MVIVFPLFFFLVFIGIQFALWHHASHVALAAAQEGARTLRVTHDEASGENRAKAMLNHLSPDAMEVQGSIDGADVAHVVVRGTAQSILPGFTFTVYEHSDGPVERFRGDDGS